MAKARSPAVPPVPDNDPLASAVGHLASELAALRQIFDEIREDFSWLTRNGLSVQSIEHVHVKRMALDPCADDWGERLEIERSIYTPRGAASLLDSDALNQVVDDLKVTFEAAAQGQLEVVLTALDGVRAEILNALRRRAESSDPKPPAPASPPPAASVASSSSGPPGSSSGISSDPPPKPPRGQLF